MSQTIALSPEYPVFYRDKLMVFFMNPVQDKRKFTKQTEYF